MSDTPCSPDRHARDTALVVARQPASRSPAACHRRMKSSGLSASGVSESVGVGVEDDGVGSGILGVGSGSPVHPARSRGTARVSASARRTCMRCLPENNVSTAKLPSSGGCEPEPGPDLWRTTSGRRVSIRRSCLADYSTSEWRVPGLDTPARASRTTRPPSGGCRVSIRPLVPRGYSTSRASRENAPRGGPLGPPLAFPLVHQPGSKRLMEASASTRSEPGRGASGQPRGWRCRAR